MVYNQYPSYFFVHYLFQIDKKLEVVIKFDKEFEVNLKYLIHLEYYIKMLNNVIICICLGER